MFLRATSRTIGWLPITIALLGALLFVATVVIRRRTGGRISGTTPAAGR